MTDANHPVTDLVILAGGQARRMQGLNKLLQCFDKQIQLLKISQHFRGKTQQQWISSNRDHRIYQHMVPNIRSFQDDATGFLGPLIGMKSAWRHVSADYVLFVPCDVTYLPKSVLKKLHQSLQQNPEAEVAYVEINGAALYPFCLLKRSSLPTLSAQIEQGELSLKKCFKLMHAQAVKFRKHALIFHSINSFDELQQYKQLNVLI